MKNETWKKRFQFRDGRGFADVSFSSSSEKIAHAGGEASVTTFSTHVQQHGDGYASSSSHSRCEVRSGNGTGKDAATGIAKTTLGIRRPE